MYSIKEMCYTLQGEGAQQGRPAVFIRFSGCNLWSGREKDRAFSICHFCDTDFVGTDGLNGGKFQTGESLAKKAFSLLPQQLKETPQQMGYKNEGGLNPMVVLTGGEPMLQVDRDLIDALKKQGFFTAIETNGTLPAVKGLDWICVSPKAGSEIVQTMGNELKVVFGQNGLNLTEMLNWSFSHFYLQPMDGKDIDQITKETIDYCKENPPWKLSLQTHKILNIP